MKRCCDLKSVFGAAAMALAVAGCGSSPPADVAPSSQGSDWHQLPSILSVEWEEGAAIVHGVASPGGRAVFAGDNGESFAVMADEQGHFQLRLAGDADGVLLQPRLQIGSSSVTGPGLLFVSSQEAGVAAVLFAGEAAYRLTGAGPLDSVDADNETLIVSGRASGGDDALYVDGREVPVVPNEEGRWAVVVPNPGGTVVLSFAGHQYQFPGTAGDAVSAPSGGGWMVRRQLGGEAVQSTWFPANK